MIDMIQGSDDGTITAFYLEKEPMGPLVEAFRVPKKGQNLELFYHVPCLLTIWFLHDTTFHKDTPILPMCAGSRMSSTSPATVVPLARRPIAFIAPGAVIFHIGTWITLNYADVR